MKKISFYKNGEKTYSIVVGIIKFINYEVWNDEEIICKMDELISIQ